MALVPTQSRALNSCTWRFWKNWRIHSRLSWEIYKPWYGWKWALRPWKARLRRQRPPSRFWILVATWARS